MSKPAFDPAWSRIIELSRRNNDAGYGEFVANWPLDYYRRRLKQIGFEGFGDVLDVGCGFGQWLIALATLNGRVEGIDVHQKRIDICDELSRDLWLDNVNVQVASAVDLPFPDESFDALFCYGVFMFLDRDKALAEFKRVLRPGGRLYVCTNARGWWLKLGIERFRADRNMAKMAFRAFASGRSRGMPNATDIRDVEPLLARHGFSCSGAAGEGLLSFAERPSDLKSHYAAKYMGYDCVVEFVATKLNEVATRPRQIDAFELVDRHVTAALESQTYSYIDALARFAGPDSADAIYATKPSVVALAQTVTRDIDRPSFLRRVAEAATRGAVSDTDRVRRCVTLCQKLFYHHFALQPFDGTTHLVDPAEVAAFRACRCGNSARFLVDILEMQGFRARIFAGACHTSAEVFLDGRWRLADASLYPPGIIPTGPDGGLLAIDDAIEDPNLLDMWPSYINYHSAHIGEFLRLYPEAGAPIEKYLRFPIFPSVGIFGAEFAGIDRAGALERYEKSRAAGEEWTSWSQLTVAERTPCKQLRTSQRPQQVLNAWRVADTIEWSPAMTLDGEAPVYDVYLSETSRGWNYGSLKIGEDFSVAGKAVRVSECRLSLPENLLRKSVFITVTARLSGRENRFYMPSEEFNLALGGRV